MTHKRTWTFALLAAALAVTVAGNSLVLGKGKPPKDDDPPEPPPVTYQITWVEVPGNRLNFVRGINNAGVAVCRTSRTDGTIYYAFPIFHWGWNGQFE